MKNATQCAKNLTALLRKLPEPVAVEWPDDDDPIAVIIQSVLLADTTVEKAQAGYRKLHEQVVDHNDLRVTMAQEMVGALGSRYPRALERCQRLRSVLRSIYLREHQVAIVSLEGKGKRDIRKYVETLDGMTPFVSARLLLTCFGVHAVPVDTQLRGRLVDAGVADSESTIEEIATWLARQIKSADGLETHLRLQAWLQEPAKDTARRGRKRGTAASRTGSSTKKSGGSGSKTSRSTAR